MPLTDETMPLTHINPTINCIENLKRHRHTHTNKQTAFGRALTDTSYVQNLGPCLKVGEGKDRWPSLQNAKLNWAGLLPNKMLT